MILVLTGSPNKNGNTNRIVSELLKDSDEEIVYFDCYERKVAPCTDCKFCSYKKGCSIKDEMMDIYDLLERADKLIISSPLYFATLSGEMINCLSRFQTYYASKYVRKDVNPKIHKALFVVTAGGYWPTMFVGVKETFHIMKLIFHIDETMECLIPECDDVNPLENEIFIDIKEEIKLFLGNKKNK